MFFAEMLFKTDEAEKLCHGLIVISYKVCCYEIQTFDVHPKGLPAESVVHLCFIGKDGIKCALLKIKIKKYI